MTRRKKHASRRTKSVNWKKKNIKFARLITLANSSFVHKTSPNVPMYIIFRPISFATEKMTRKNEVENSRRMNIVVESTSIVNN